METARCTLSTLAKGILLTAILLGLIPNAFAAPSRRVPTLGISQLVSNVPRVTSSVASQQISAIEIRVPVEAGAQARITFTRSLHINGLTGHNVGQILQGEVRYTGPAASIRSSKKTLGVASAVIKESKDGEYDINIIFETRGARRLSKRAAVITLRASLSAASPEVMQLTRERARPKTACGTSNFNPTLESPVEGLVRTQQVQEIAVLLEGDTEFFSGAGSNSITELSQMISLTDAIFRRDLNLTLKPTIVEAPVPFASPFRYDENFQLDFFLEMSQKRPFFDEDIYAVITGKTPPDASLKNVAGIANAIGATCKTPSLSQTVVRRFADFPSGTFYTFAHEVGHLIGGEHDDSKTGTPSTGYVMNSGTGSVDEFLERFSNFSIAQIGDYLTQNGSCLAPGSDLPSPAPSPAPAPPEGTPAPEPTDDYLIFAEVTRSGGRDAVYFYTYLGDEAIGGESLAVYRVGNAKKPIRRIKTRASGFVLYRPPSKGRYYATLVSSPGVTSNIVRVKR